MVGEQEGFHFTAEDWSSNRAKQRSRVVEQRSETWWAGMAISLAWRELRRIAVACSSKWLRLDESLTCAKEAQQARAPIFASCRLAGWDSEPSLRRTNQGACDVVLTRDSVHPSNYRCQSSLPERESMDNIRWLWSKWLASSIRESTSTEGEHVRT